MAAGPGALGPGPDDGESIFQPLGASLGLRLLTPYSVTKAVAEGAEITASDKQTVDGRAEQRLIKVWVFNSQNVTPEVQQVNALAQARGIPIATLTETLSPASFSIEEWQVAELEGLLKALHRATGRQPASRGGRRACRSAPPPPARSAPGAEPSRRAC